MFTIGEVNENKVLKLSIQGKMTMDDYRQAIPKIEELLNKYGRLRFYMEMIDFSGSDIGAVWEGIKFDFAHKSKYDRCAIIGDKLWEELMTKFSAMFINAPVKFFYKQNAEKAWEWVNQS